uniref:EF-hand domain-containing protein n=1 Tax=Ciona savignyi TaxID=51511 RepID=H2YW33_CIOSA
EPKSGFQIAFNMFDRDGNQRVDKKEFLVVSWDELQIFIFSRYFESVVKLQRTALIPPIAQAVSEEDNDHSDTTLLVHLFGRSGKNDLSFEDFHRCFMNNLQTEVFSFLNSLHFLEYSRGMATISEVDFACMLLRFTDVGDIEEHIQKLRERIPEEKGISFEEFRSFFQFLNNLEDFAIAMQMYTLAGRSIGQDEFMRAVQISTGHQLSEHLVHTLFQIFDKDGDNRLSHVEFIGVMKDRINRGFR